jgi:hypothetical protein
MAKKSSTGGTRRRPDTPQTVRRRRLLVTAGVLCVGVAVVLSARAASSDVTSDPAAAQDRTAADRADGTTASAGSAQASDAPKSPAAGGAGRPDPSGGPRTAAVVTWLAGGGQARISSMVMDVAAVSSARSNPGGQDLRAACGVTRRDVRAARAYPAVPDAQAQQAWRSALAGAERGARDCLTGASRKDADLVRAGADRLTAAGSRLNQVTVRLATLAR